jgi:serine-type D-Ala-D-Ala carboxypeptidase (penicillin-binding protein 5/6)
MSSPPFMNMGRSHERRLQAQRRRRRRRALIAGALLTVVVMAVLLGVVFVGANGEPRGHGHLAGHHAAASGPVALSQAGLPLASPALTLTGLSTPLLDPVHLAFAQPPRSGLLFNLASGQVLWQRDPHERVRIASLTKMMTALLTVMNTKPDEPVLITRRAADMPGSKVGVLPVGHHVRTQTLLYGLLLPSGNDAAVALAEHVSTRVSTFVRLMNTEAARLGMGCTRYSNPSGYYDLGNYSCAQDLAVLAREDLLQPRIATVTRTLSAELPFPIEGGKLFLYNNNPLLIYHYPGTTGLKTGFTEAAGRCLVGTAERDGVKLGVVILHSTEPGRQASALLNEGFEDVYHLAPVPAQEMPPGA